MSSVGSKQKIVPSIRPGTSGSASATKHVTSLHVNTVGSRAGRPSQNQGDQAASNVRVASQSTKISAAATPCILPKATLPKQPQRVKALGTASLKALHERSGVQSKHSEREYGLFGIAGGSPETLIVPTQNSQQHFNDRGAQTQSVRARNYALHYQTNTSRNVKKIHTQSFRDQDHSQDSFRQHFDSASRSKRELLYDSANRYHMTKGTAIFQSQGRLSEGRAPSGSRSNHVYASPHFKPNSSFNFWNDLNLNQSTRNKWENQSVGPLLEIPENKQFEKIKSPGSTSDLISMKLNSQMDGGKGIATPSERNLNTSINDSLSFHPGQVRTSKIIPTKTLTLNMTLNNSQALQGQQQESLNNSRILAADQSAIINMSSMTSQSKVPVKHQARFLYSQIDLTGDLSTSSRASSRLGVSTATNYYSLSKAQNGTIIFEPKTPQRANPPSIQNTTTHNLNYRTASKEERKVSANLKYFTSQITSELPGPKVSNSNTSVYALSKLDQKLHQEQSKLDLFKEDEKKVVKSQLFYGSLYQQMDQKYIPKPINAPSSLKSWNKEVKNLEWNRNPENSFTKKARDFLFYNSTRPY